MNDNPIRLPDEFLNFLARASSNRVVVNVDRKAKSYGKTSLIVVKFFKKNPEIYEELIKMEDENA